MSQFAVIGLGRFGYYLASTLYEYGHDVLAVDINEKRAETLKGKCSSIVVADATDKAVLESLGMKDAHAVIVCIGSPMEASVLATLNLKDIGVEQILVKAISDIHSRLLSKVGATEIFFPERDEAISLARCLHSPNVIEYLPFLEGYRIIEFAPPKKFIGKTLKDLNLINTYGTQVVAVKEVVPERMDMVPKGDFVVKDSDILILLGPDDSLDRLLKI